MPRGVYERTPEHREKIGAARRGRKLSKATRARMSAAKRGRRPKNFEECLRKAHAAPRPKGPDHPDWKGDAVSYSGLHQWVRRELGTPCKCDNCGTTKAAQFEWANRSGEYKRELADWIRLCTLCHRRMDRAACIASGWKPWNKGKRVQTNTGRTHFKKGVRSNRAGEFKKGLRPHNKHLTERACATCRRMFQPPDRTRKYCSRQCYWQSLRK